MSSAARIYLWQVGDSGDGGALPTRATLERAGALDAPLRALWHPGTPAHEGLARELAKRSGAALRGSPDWAAAPGDAGAEAAAERLERALAAAASELAGEVGLALTEAWPLRALCARALGIRAGDAWRRFESRPGTLAALDVAQAEGGRCDVRLAGFALDWCPPRTSGGREHFPGGPGSARS